ncbi:hypothetical protein L2E82_25607 [Cichorium intybus]|uniref:Uncharacterized protein n=1 Tax=Cichorium intybus TaxID=13427 RepID=A0ACB9E512_CICIN|nr:hypothetical protein L2E82_25607 [Cichorium intybus]
MAGAAKSGSMNRSETTPPRRKGNSRKDALHPPFQIAMNTNSRKRSEAPRKKITMNMNLEPELSPSQIHVSCDCLRRASPREKTTYCKAVDSQPL